MKSLMSILLCTFLIFSVACKKKSKASENEDTTTVELKTGANSNSDTTEFEAVKDCDDFIDQYEEWMDDYVALLEKHKDNPVDLVTSPEYTQMAMQAADWASNWSAKLTTSCAANPTYEKRMEAIQEKMEKKLTEIGLKK